MVIFQAIFGLVFVIGLLYLILKIVQKYGKSTILGGANKDKATIMGVTYIDEGTKIVSAIHGPSKYLFVVGKNTSLLLDKYDNKE
ncbi:MAG: hypothetical protein RLZZ59_403 [Pseudomonadota bacterium]|jgi:lysophospholipid acyltransferase (LPLAT)-like uncharacterized protein